MKKTSKKTAKKAAPKATSKVAAKNSKLYKLVASTFDTSESLFNENGGLTPNGLHRL